MEEERKDLSNDELRELLDKQSYELAKIKAESIRKDTVIQKLCKQNSRMKKQYREEEKEKNAIKDQTEKELEQAKRELRVIDASKRYVAMLGMDISDADETAKYEIDKDMESWIKMIQKHARKVYAEAQQKAIQGFLENRPEVHAGIGDVDRNAPSLEMARQYLRNRVNMDILNRY